MATNEYPIDDEFWKWWNNFWAKNDILTEKSTNEIKSHKIMDKTTLNLWRKDEWMSDKNYKKP